MNPLFQGYQLRGTLQGNPVFMDRQQLDVLRMIVQGYGQQAGQGVLQQMLNTVSPGPRPQAPMGGYQHLGIRG
jgi:hypothetical protein